jgi:hypothetical protein
MRWKFLASISILACSLFISLCTQAQDTDSIPTVKDSTLPVNRTDSTITDTIPDSIDPALIELRDSKNPKEYIIAGITITGTKYLDEQLLLSISGLTVGEKVLIPGGDNFSKAINKSLEAKPLCKRPDIFYQT